MISPATLVVATVVLGAGTYAFRFSGPVLRSRVELSPGVQRLVAASSVTLLTALVATTALLDGRTFVGLARPAGVVVGGVLAWRRAPFVVVVLAAAGVAAGLRAVGAR